MKPEIDYYWYEGERHYLTIDSSKLFVVYKNTATAICNQNATCIIDTIYKNTTYKWEVIENSGQIGNKQAVSSNSDVAYYSTFYISNETGQSIGLSNLIHIRLKNENDYPILKELLDRYNMSIFSQNPYLPLWITIACNDLSHGNALTLCNQLHESGLFEIVEPDFMVTDSSGQTSFTKPNDSRYSDQWYLEGKNSIKWPEASNISRGENINVGLIDSGVALSHPDFANSNINYAYDSTLPDPWYANNIYSIHGTNCASIICASTNNGIGIAGISPSVRLNSYSFPFGTYRPNASQELSANLYIALNSEDVVSCSWGGYGVSSEIKETITMFMPSGRNNKGTVLVFATGNDSYSVAFPANCHPNILAVGATDKNGKKASFSNYGSELDIVAPGVDILMLSYDTAKPNKFSYHTDDGTSFACPQVAAVAALILSVNPNLTNVQVNTIIEETAQKTGGYTYSNVSNRPNGTWNQYTGYGLLDAAAAVQKAQSMLK